jgi:hypothetical protein
VLRFAIPAGSIIAAATFAAYALARAHGLPLVQQRTAATLVTLILSLCVLVLLAVPLTWRRIVLVGAALAGFALLFPVPAVRRFYELQLPRSGLAPPGRRSPRRRRARGLLGPVPPAWPRTAPGGPPVTATSEPGPGALTVTATARHPGNEVPAAARAVRLLFVHRPGKRCRSGAARQPGGPPASLSRVR